jgi:hypothetical protein
MFRFTIQKTSEEIKTAANQKINRLNAKIEERIQRIAKLREDNGIDDAAFTQLLLAARQQQHAQQAAYSYTANTRTLSGEGQQMEERTISAGAVNFLLSESDHIEAERTSVKNLQRIVRNLRPVRSYAHNGTQYSDDHFELSNEELDFLSF